MSFILRIVGIRTRFVLLALFALGAGFFCSTRYVPTEYLQDIYPLLTLAGIFFFLLSLLLAYSVISPVNKLIELLENRKNGINTDVIRPGGYDIIARLATSLNEYFIKVDDSHLKIDEEHSQIIDEKSRLEGLLSTSTSEMELLLSVVETIQGRGDLPTVASAVLRDMNSRIRCQWSSLFIYRNDALSLLASEGLNADLSTLLVLEGTKAVQFCYGEGLSGKALSLLKTQVANDGYRNKSFKLFSGPDKHYRSIKNLCVVPLESNGKGIGLLMSFNIASSGGYNDDHVRFLERVGRLLSMAVAASDPEAGFMIKHVDALSGLITPGCWRNMATTEVERSARTSTPAGFIAVDIRFKQRMLSPSERSRIVSLAGHMIRRNLRGVDLATREGYRFMMFLPQTNSLGTMYLAGRIKDACDALSYDNDSGEPLFTATAAVASFPEDIDNVNELEERVCRALDKANSTGESKLICVESYHGSAAENSDGQSS